MKDRIDIYDKFIMGVFFLAFIFWVILLSSCNAYKGISRKEPKSDEERKWLASRFLKTFPQDVGTVKEGETIVILDSSEYWKNASVLANQKKSIIITELKTKYVDTCLSVFDRFEEGFNSGFNSGFYESKAKSPSTKRVDTVFKDKSQTLAQLYVLNANLVDSTKELYRLRSNYNELHSKTRNFKWSISHLFSFAQMWIILILLSLILLRKPLLNLWKKSRLFPV